MIQNVLQVISVCKPVISYLAIISVVCGMGESQCRKENTTDHKWSFIEQATAVVTTGIIVNIIL